MLESNRDEERLARIEQMVQTLQRENAVLKRVQAKLIDVIQVTVANDSPRHISVRPHRSAASKPRM